MSDQSPDKHMSNLDDGYEEAPSEKTPKDQHETHAQVPDFTQENDIDHDQQPVPAQTNYVPDFTDEEEPVLASSEATNDMQNIPDPSSGASPDERPTIPTPEIKPDVHAGEESATSLTNESSERLDLEPTKPESGEVDADSATPPAPDRMMVRVFFPRKPGDAPLEKLVLQTGAHSNEATDEHSAETRPTPRPDDTSSEAEAPLHASTQDMVTRPAFTPQQEEEEDATTGEQHVGAAARSTPETESDEPRPAPIDWEPDSRPTPPPSLYRRESSSVSKPPAQEKQRIPLLALLVLIVAALLLTVVVLFVFGIVTIPDSLAQYLTPEAGPQTTSAPSDGAIIEPTEIPAGASTQVPTVTPRPTATPEPDIIMTENGLTQRGVEMVPVPESTFRMGTGSGHIVFLSAFYIDAYEVTNAHFARCVDAGGCEPPTESINYSGDQHYGTSAFAQHPVINVTWEQANTYCTWRGAQLPTEAQWEMAARFNPDTDNSTLYPWGESWDPARLNFCDASCALEDNADTRYNDTWPQTSRVGSFPDGASALGAYDMAGNVAEWVADWYDANYYAISPIEDPTGPATGATRVVRGGAWGVSESRFFTGAVRTSFTPDQYGPGIGFRCAVYASDIQE